MGGRIQRRVCAKVEGMTTVSENTSWENAIKIAMVPEAATRGGLTLPVAGAVAVPAETAAAVQMASAD